MPDLSLLPWCLVGLLTALLIGGVGALKLRGNPTINVSPHAEAHASGGGGSAGIPWGTLLVAGGLLLAASALSSNSSSVTQDVGVHEPAMAQERVAHPAVATVVPTIIVPTMVIAPTTASLPAVDPRVALAEEPVPVAVTPVSEPGYALEHVAVFLIVVLSVVAVVEMIALWARSRERRRAADDHRDKMEREARVIAQRTLDMGGGTVTVQKAVNQTPLEDYAAEVAGRIEDV